MALTTVRDLARVIYSSGKVFDGLSTGRLDTENFLESGSTAGISSRADLALLEDLRDAASFILTHVGAKIDAAYLRAVNATITRSGALRPGALRTADQRIGVRTRHGRYEPAAVDALQLDRLVREATAGEDPAENALNLFLRVAKAQPFEDGNKRTALFAANGLLIGGAAGLLLTVPYNEDDPFPADLFNDYLARAYVFNDDEPVKELLREAGFVSATVAKQPHHTGIQTPRPRTNPTAPPRSAPPRTLKDEATPINPEPELEL